MKHDPSADAVEEDGRQYGLDVAENYPHRPRNHSTTLPFSALFTELLNPLNENKSQSGPRLPGQPRPGTAKKTSPYEQRRNIIERFIARWRADVGDDFYPALRLILPDKDRDRGVYGLKENTIGKLLVKLMKIDKNSEDGYKLLHWKLPGQTVAGRMAGDFAGRCYEALAKRPLRSDIGDLRIGEVNELLDRLAAASGQSEQLTIFEVFYQRMNAEELQWLIRIVLKQLKVGASERTFLDLWHPDGEALFSVSSSLRKVCWELYNPQVRLDQGDTRVALMQCFQPQLAQFQMATSFEKVVEKLKPTTEDPEFWIEEKLDGERMQMHMEADPNISGGRRFCFWSRKAKDYTSLYGDGLENDKAALTRHLKGTFADGVRNLILDGEMVTWDPLTRKMVAFGTLKTAALAARENPYDVDGPRPVFRVFDMLYLNDQPLTRYTLRDRRRALEQTVRPVPNRLEIHDFAVALSPDDVEPRLRQVVADSSEGLVLKNPRSMYRLNSRNDDWIKVKPEYMSEFGESLDCLVVGGYFGSGRRGGTISSFLCGLRVSENHVRAGADPEKCLSFFKVGGGFKAEDYAEIRHHTEGKWVDWDPANPPSGLIQLAGGDRLQYERPDVWIRPSHSIVLSVKAASVGPSESFAVRETLRFPRFRRLRTDRAWDTALDVEQFQALRSRVDETTREQTNMSIEDRRKRRPVKKARRGPVIAGREVGGPAVDSVPRGSKVFAGIDFCVLSGATEPERVSQSGLDAIIRENGGRITQRPGSDPSTLYIAEKRVVKVASLIKRGGLDIIRPRWVFDCLAQRDRPYLLPFEERHLFHATPASSSLARRNVDALGDSFARDVDRDEARALVTSMPMERSGAGRGCDGTVSLLKQLATLETGSLRGSLFGRCRVHLVLEEDAGRLLPMKLDYYVRFGGGRTVSQLADDQTTHVVLVTTKGSSLEAERARDVRLKLSSRTRVPRIVQQAWVVDCWEECTLLDEERYAPA